MKGISLSPPYGTLIALRLKLIETRGWTTTHRGPLAIHQAAAPGPKGTTEAALWELCASEPFRNAPTRVGLMPPARLPRGKIVAVVELRDCVPIGMLTDGTPMWMDYREVPPVLTAVQEPERSFGHYAAGRWAWLLSNIRALPMPIPARGMPGLWDVPVEIEQQIARQLAPPACPHCGAAIDVAARISGDTVLCRACSGWVGVRFVAGGVELTRAVGP